MLHRAAAAGSGHAPAGGGTRAALRRLAGCGGVVAAGLSSPRMCGGRVNFTVLSCTDGKILPSYLSQTVKFYRLRPHGGQSQTDEWKCTRPSTRWLHRPTGGPGKAPEHARSTGALRCRPPPPVLRQTVKFTALSFTDGKFYRLAATRGEIRMTRMKMPVSINPMAPQPHRGPREGPQTLTGCGGTPSSADAKPGQTASLRGSATGPN